MLSAEEGRKPHMPPPQRHGLREPLTRPCRLTSTDGALGQLAGGLRELLAVWQPAQVTGARVQQRYLACDGLAAGLPQGVPTWWQSSSCVSRDTGWGVPR